MKNPHQNSIWWGFLLDYTPMHEVVPRAVNTAEMIDARICSVTQRGQALLCRESTCAKNAQIQSEGKKRAIAFIANVVLSIDRI